MFTRDMDGHGMGFHWPVGRRKVWIVAMFCGTLLLYAARSAVPLCIAAMSVDLKWDKELDVSSVTPGGGGYSIYLLYRDVLPDKVSFSGSSVSPDVCNNRCQSMSINDQISTIISQETPDLSIAQICQLESMSIDENENQCQSKRCNRY